MRLALIVFALILVFILIAVMMGHIALMATP